LCKNLCTARRNHSEALGKSAAGLAGAAVVYRLHRQGDGLADGWHLEPTPPRFIGWRQEAPMIRLVLLVAATYATWRMTLHVVEEDRHHALLPAPSPDNRPPVGWKDQQIASR
jgi:hypothetical protein